MSTALALAGWNSTVMPTYGTPKLALVKGQNATVWDADGKQYIDFLAGIAVNTLGHAHPALVQAVTEQVSTLGHTSNFATHPQVLKLAQRLVELTHPSARVFFCNSGAEANEAAIKLSRKTGRTQIVCLKKSFHGRTTGALSLTGQPEKSQPFYPLLSDVVFIEPNNLAELRKAVTDKTAAIWLEPILGEGGVIPLSSEFLQAAREICDVTGALLVLDEVQTGIARSGTMFAYEQAKIAPDVLLLAKGLGGGLPIGACVAFGQAASFLIPGQHGSTFGGNPISCAAANAVLDVVASDDLMNRARFLEHTIRSEIAGLPGVLEVRGSGAMLGIVLADTFGPDVVDLAASLGLITNSPVANILRLVPPLTISNEELSQGLQILKTAIVQSFKEQS
ncbi:MAG: acetylornithine transaminase [Actinobacteria bacterium]|nr:acetylornithine transaminase [Actinomycetota bacterium]NBY14915.1 acetylornithine transaminase [Actinomycetota bacterium]